MKKGLFLLVAIFAVVALSFVVVNVAKHTVASNNVKIDSVATMTYGLEGGGYNMLSFHERHRATDLRPVDKSAMKLRPIQKIAK